MTYFVAWVVVGMAITFLHMAIAETSIHDTWVSGPFGRFRVVLGVTLSILGFWVVILYWKFTDE